VAADKTIRNGFSQDDMPHYGQMRNHSTLNLQDNTCKTHQAMRLTAAIASAPLACASCGVPVEAPVGG
jgi:hypothetical protein